MHYKRLSKTRAIAWKATGVTKVLRRSRRGRLCFGHVFRVGELVGWEQPRAICREITGMGSHQGPSAPELEGAGSMPEFGRRTSLSEKLLAVAIRAQNFTGSTGIAIALTEGGDDMICRANWGPSAPEVGARLSIEHSFTGLCVRTGEPVRCDDAETDPRVNPEACRALGISSIAAAPVRRGVKVIGVLAAFSDTPHAFTEKHLVILGTLAEVIVELLEEKKPAAGASAETQEPAKPVAISEKHPVAPQTEVPQPVISAAPAVPVVTAAAAQVAKRESAAQAADAPSTRVVSFPVSEKTEAPAAIHERTPAGADPQPTQPVRSRPVPARGFSTGSTTAESSVRTLDFAAMQRETGEQRRWLLPAVIAAVFAVMAFAGWRLYAARKASSTRVVAAAAAPPSVATSTAAQTADSRLIPAAESATPKQQSAAAPKPMAQASIVEAKLGKSAAAPAKVEADTPRAPEVVLEKPLAVRRPRSTAAPQVEEAEAPQIALANPAMLPNLAHPAPAAVAAPVSQVTPAKLVRRVEPVYPEWARRMQASGEVLLTAAIGKDGKVGDVRWLRGNPVFRDSSVNAIKQWKYNPATLNGQAVESVVDITLKYTRPR
jgi:TonB family protein